MFDHFEIRAPARARDISLEAFHDGDGWCIRAERPGFEPLLFGCYAATWKDAQWAAGEVAKSIGAMVRPFHLT